MLQQLHVPLQHGWCRSLQSFWGGLCPGRVSPCHCSDGCWGHTEIQVQRPVTVQRHSQCLWSQETLGTLQGTEGLGATWGAQGRSHLGVQGSQHHRDLLRPTAWREVKWVAWEKLYPARTSNGSASQPWRDKASSKEQLFFKKSLLKSFNPKIWFWLCLVRLRERRLVWVCDYLPFRRKGGRECPRPHHVCSAIGICWATSSHQTSPGVPQISVFCHFIINLFCPSQSQPWYHRHGLNLKSEVRPSPNERQLLQELRYRNEMGSWLCCGFTENTGSAWGSGQLSHVCGGDQMCLQEEDGFCWYPALCFLCAEPGVCSITNTKNRRWSSAPHKWNYFHGSVCSKTGEHGNSCWVSPILMLFPGQDTGMSFAFGSAVQGWAIFYFHTERCLSEGSASYRGWVQHPPLGMRLPPRRARQCSAAGSWQ